MQSQVHHGNSPKKSNSMGINANGSNLNLKFSDLSDQDSTIDETKPLYIDEVSFQISSPTSYWTMSSLIGAPSGEHLKIYFRGRNNPQHLNLSSITVYNRMFMSIGMDQLSMQDKNKN